MKIVISVFFLALCFVIPAASQSVVITPKKVTYERPKSAADHKRSFTVRYPKVKAATPALSRKIENTLSYSKVLGLNIDEEIRDVQWLEEADYEVNYNARGILVVTLQMNGSGAYPDGSSRSVLIDTKTGNRLRAADIFSDLGGLTAKIRKMQSLEIANALKEIKADPENGDVAPDELFEGKKFANEDLNEFQVDGRGVMFIYNYSFPHVVRALEPEGRYSYSWAEIKPFIKRGGLLAKFVR